MLHSPNAGLRALTRKCDAVAVELHKSAPPAIDPAKLPQFSLLLREQELLFAVARGFPAEVPGRLRYLVSPNGGGQSESYTGQAESGPTRVGFPTSIGEGRSWVPVGRVSRGFAK
jgi:hypothetical protein